MSPRLIRRSPLAIALAVAVSVPAVTSTAPPTRATTTQVAAHVTTQAQARVHWVADDASHFLTQTASEHHHSAAATTTSTARAPKSKVAATRAAYRKAVAKEKKALTKLNRAKADIRAAYRAWPAAVERNQDATVAVMTSAEALATLQRDAADARAEVEAAREALLDALELGLGIITARDELVRAQTDLDAVVLELSEATAEHAVLAAAQRTAADALRAVEKRTRASTHAASVAWARAKKKTFTARVAHARASTPASTSSAPYALTGSGRGVWFWDACTGPITVKVSTPALAGQAAKNARAEARRAVARLKKVSGLPLSYRGATTEVPTLDRAVRSADIVISYTSPRISPGLGLGRGTVGIGGSWSRADERGATRRQAGFATVDAEATSSSRNGRGPLRSMVLLHELGHAVGLNHVTQGKQLMNPRASASMPSSFATGDRNGLKRLRAYSRC